jgi:hypothetical protein
VSVVPTGGPLVGRDDELRRFAEVLQSVVVQRHPAVVLVTGEAGMGNHGSCRRPEPLLAVAVC